MTINLQIIDDRNITVKEKQEIKKVNRSIAKDIALGILNSRTFFTLLCITAYVLPIALILNPAGWVIAVAVISGIALSILLQPNRILQEFMMEYSVFGRLFDARGPKYNEIILPPFTSSNGKLYLGSLPNRLTSQGENLANNLKIKHVLTILEPWERKPFGLSLPYSRKDYKELGIDNHQISVVDLNIPTNEQLDEAADFIHTNLSKGENVYVHCKAGMGRSASTIGAYLIKYHRLHPQVAARYIKENRSVSLITEKDLTPYWHHCYPHWASEESNTDLVVNH